MNKMNNINYHGKRFCPVSNTPNGEVSNQTVFFYEQEGNIITAKYKGGDIREGQLIAIVLPSGQLDMRYQHVNENGDFMLGKCLSTPEILPDGRIKLKEQWQWLSGDCSSGYSEVEEIKEGSQ